MGDDHYQSRASQLERKPIDPEADDHPLAAKVDLGDE